MQEMMDKLEEGLGVALWICMFLGIIWIGGVNKLVYPDPEWTPERQEVYDRFMTTPMEIEDFDDYNFSMDSLDKTAGL